MSSIRRKDMLLNEAIEILDHHFKRCKYDYAQAFNRLNRYEEEFIDEELAHAASDPRYFLENYYVVKTEHEGFRTLYPFWDSQEIFYYEIQELIINGKPVKVLVLKARQLGMSTLSEGLIFHRTIFNEAVNAMIVAQDPGQADYLFSMFTRAFENVPWWMQPEVRYRSKGRYMVFDSESPERTGLQSEIFVEAANKISGVGVGKTIRAIHMSELSAWANPETLTEQLFPTMNAPDELAVMESTARGRQGFWYEFWKRSVNKWGDGVWQWKPIFIEWFRCPNKYSLPIEKPQNFKLTDDERGFREKARQTTGFVIPDEMFNWKRMKIDETVAIAGDEWGFYQEFPSTWMESFQSSGFCAFPKRKLQQIMDTVCCEPLWVGEISYSPGSQHPVKTNLTNVREAREKDQRYQIPSTEQVGGRLRIWELPEPGETYYAGADIAYGVEGRDFSCCQIIRIGHGGAPDVQVAEWHGWINPTPFGHVIVALATWYNMAELALELNGVGEKTYMEVFRILEYPNLFRWKHYDKVKNFMSDYMCWVTNHKTRPLIITALRERLMENTATLYSEALLDEMMDFGAEDEDSRFEGQESNDDRVMAIMIALWCAHDSDYGKWAAMQTGPTARGKEKFFVIGPDGQVYGKPEGYEMREEAMAAYAGRMGFSVRRQVVRLDFSNTDYSPVHDRSGPRARMYESGVPAEQVRLDNLIETNGQNSDDTDWRCW